MVESCEQRDLIRTKMFPMMLGPTAGLVAGQILWPQGSVVFSVALLLSWAAFCGMNARRCGRRHCYFTAPILLLGAAAVLLLHFDLVRFPGHWVNAFVLIGVLFSCVAEAVFGRYVGKA